MNVMAPNCASWGVPARGTTRRTYHNFQGVCDYQFVAEGNLMVARSLDSLHFSSEKRENHIRAHIYVQVHGVST